MRRFLEAGLVVLLAAVWIAGAGAAHAEDPVIGDVLAILKERGIVDEARYTELVTKNEAYEKENQSLLGQIEWSGDFRGRLENFWYDRDDLGGDRDNRTRGRYRLRLGGVATINDHVLVAFRLGSGDGGSRSTNRSFGSGEDFDPDPLFIDRATIELTAPSGWGPEGSKLQLIAGKQSNPFLWKKGKDYLLWDHDISPEGVSVRFQMDPTDRLGVFANAGYFISDENALEEDPHVLGLQGGVRYSASEDVELGGRVTWYSWRSLDPDFLDRATASGNLADLGGLGDGFNAIELAAYLQWSGSEVWPVLVYAHYARNLAADSALTGSDEDAGWNFGVEVGDKTQILKLGLGYAVAEANFWPGQFTDSDLVGGVTNRRGFTLYGSKQVLRRTDLNLSLFMTEDLETELPLFATSVRGSERIRLRTDIVVRF